MCEGHQLICARCACGLLTALMSVAERHSPTVATHSHTLRISNLEVCSYFGGQLAGAAERICNVANACRGVTAESDLLSLLVPTVAKMRWRSRGNAWRSNRRSTRSPNAPSTRTCRPLNAPEPALPSGALQLARV